jgi:hypothetical protein
MSKPRKTDVDLRHDLSSDFVETLAADWKQNGPTVIAQVRQEAPDKYCELVAKRHSTRQRLQAVCHSLQGKTQPACKLGSRLTDNVILPSANYKTRGSMNWR